MDLNEMMYGADRTRQMILWDAELIALDEKYIYWLSQRQDPLYPDDERKTDNLRNHFITEIRPEYTRIGFRNESDLPAIIRDDLIATFNCIFK